MVSIALIDRLRQEFGSAVLTGVDLSARTTFKIGGKARVLVEVSSAGMLKRVIGICNEHNTDVLCLGAGSNLLIADGGINSRVVISLNKLNHIKRKAGFRLLVGAGVRIANLLAFCIEKGLGGLEWAGGLPASVGGACYMNAGAFSGDMSKVVESVTILADGKIRKVTGAKLFFNYRDSVFKSCLNCVIIEVLIRLSASTPKDVRERTANYINRRAQTQKVGLPSAGSVFKRMGEEVVPARIIDSLGLKGMRVGGAEVSKVHAGYIVNAGNATANDVLKLIKEIQKIVFGSLKLGLQTEIIFWGD